MTQIEVAAVAVGAFALFMFGYSLGWLRRGRVADRVASARHDDDIEAAVRRSQR